MKTKIVQYSYPSSPNADRFKMPKGCWTVELVEGCKPPKALRGFAKREDAVAYAETLPEKWDHFYMMGMHKGN